MLALVWNDDDDGDDDDDDDDDGDDDDGDDDDDDDDDDDVDDGPVRFDDQEGDDDTDDSHVDYAADDGHDEAQKDFFHRREFDLVLQGDAGNEIHCRYTCFRDAEIRMEIGAVYTHLPSKHKLVMKDAYKPLERELVFDIASNPAVCCSSVAFEIEALSRFDQSWRWLVGEGLKCWTFMKAAIEILRRSLREEN
ncbi:DNA primase small subunit [Symbiodinium microadriaticum]|uniref:DNA primase small subunit n=1 Tax=Symbiodinium microadriaticum TaxID=2951 RepID=A0A1Q9ERE6_SYMMI|nr:DNA primase small subunit [Symbiodinium microadriaticum]